MATLDDLSLVERAFMKGYPFYRHAIDPVPCAPLGKPLARSRVALVTTAGLHTTGQDPFDAGKMGDPSFREIPGSIEVQSLSEAHKSKAFDHAGINADKNIVFPLDRFRELAGRGEVGELNHRHFSFMGSMLGPRNLIDQTAPEVAGLLRSDGVDAVFLTPA